MEEKGALTPCCGRAPPTTKGGADCFQEPTMLRKKQWFHNNFNRIRLRKYEVWCTFFSMWWCSVRKRFIQNPVKNLSWRKPLSIFRKTLSKLYLYLTGFWIHICETYRNTNIWSENLHCVKSVQIGSYFWSEYRKIRTRNNFVFEHFSRINLRIQSEYRKIRTINNSVFGHFSRVNLRIQSEYRKIRTRNNSVFGHFSRSSFHLEVLTPK